MCTNLDINFRELKVDINFFIDLLARITLLRRINQSLVLQLYSFI